jgi:hypothetical protein
MAHESHRNYLIISRPNHSAESGVWCPYATVLWQDGAGFHYHDFVKVDVTFLTEEEALAYGFTIARSWIDTER